MSVKRRTFLQGAAGAIGLAVAQGALSKIAYSARRSQRSHAPQRVATTHGHRVAARARCRTWSGRLDSSKLSTAT